LAGEHRTQSPKPDEIEISLFGPGFGECIAVHLGNGQWMVVDSCIDPQSREPAVIQYFSQIGVDPATSVRLIIASHWHDDHIRGLGQLFKKCTSAEFVCSEALGSQDFLEVVYAQGERIMAENISGLDEFHEIIDELKRRAQAVGGRLEPPIFAVADRCLWQSVVSSVDVPCTVHALSPSDAALLASKLEIARLSPKIKTPKRGIWPSGKNHAAIALWVSVGDRVALLGSDLEETGDPYSGWQVILKSTRKPQAKASIFKVPHHGSATGDNPGVWKEMLADDPIAVLSPYMLCGLTLPQKSDIDRLCSLTKKAFITTPQKSRVIKRESAVEKTLKDLNLSPKQVNISIGHIRLRATQGEPWKVELLQEAQSLCKQSA
jgi:beta-lactamase superfamily II metal-dependent hydrolase